MAKKKSGKRIEVQISELEAVVKDVHSCAACGKPIEPDATTCPHCGTPVREAAELQKKATESLSDLEKELAEASPPQPESPLAPATLQEQSTKGGLESAAEVVAMVSAPTPEAPMEEASPEVAPPAALEVEAESEPQAEVETEAEKPGDLEGFIEEIEAEVGPAAPEGVRAAPKPAAAAKPTVRAVAHSAPARSSKLWVAPVAAGGAVYIFALLYLLPMGRFLVASFMILGAVLVVAGIRSKPLAAARRIAGSGSPIVDDYVCPLCGTGIAARATQCPTCGAVFED